MNSMNNPNKNREIWKEFQQDMQDWVLSVMHVAEGCGWDYIGHSDLFNELMNWAELRYIDGRNHQHCEDEFLAFMDYGEKVKRLLGDI